MPKASASVALRWSCFDVETLSVEMGCRERKFATVFGGHRHCEIDSDSIKVQARCACGYASSGQKADPKIPANERREEEGGVHFDVEIGCE
jgi:hypothetical protein